MAVKGVFASNQNIAGARKGDFASGLLQTQPTGNAPLLALSSGMPSSDAMDTVVSWFEENHLTGRTTITNNAGTGTSFTLSDASAVVQGQVYLIETTGEYIFVDSVTASVATVTRGLGGSTIVAVDGSSTPVGMQRIGTAHEEGSAKPTAVANLGFPRFNYMQIFRNAWDVTGTARALEWHTGDIVAKNKADAALFHAEDIERSIIFGLKTIATQNGKPFRLMDGITNQIVTNVQAQSGSTSWVDLRDFFQSIFETNIKGQPNERIMFTGNEVVATVEDMMRLDSTIHIVPGATDAGFKFKNLMTPFGDIVMITHPLFTENPVFTKNMLILHPAAVKMRFLRRTMNDLNDKNGTRAGVDADFGVITTEMTVQYMAEKTGGYFTGIDTASAS